MKRMISVLIIGLAGLSGAQAQERSTDDLSWLEGTWTFVDRAMPTAGFEYEETGTRVCERILDGRYIQCTSYGLSGENERTYIHLWTWNEREERIEMLSLFGNLPFRDDMTGEMS